MSRSPRMPSRMPTSTTPVHRRGCVASSTCLCGAVPAMPRRSGVAGWTATARRWSTVSSGCCCQSRLTRLRVSCARGTPSGGSRCWRCQGTLRAPWRSGGHGTGHWCAATFWPIWRCAVGTSGWFAHRPRCRPTPLRITAWCAVWPNCGPGWSASGTAHRLPILVGSPLRSSRCDNPSWWPGQDLGGLGSTNIKGHSYQSSINILAAPGPRQTRPGRYLHDLGGNLTNPRVGPDERPCRASYGDEKGGRPGPDVHP